jgi:hypothetical protein
MGVQLELTNPNRGLLFQKKNWQWCFQELFDRMSGVFDNPAKYANPGLAYQYRPAWRRKLVKEGGTFCYAYGEAFNEQIPEIVKQLKRQKTSREAIMNVWTPMYLWGQNEFPRRPCTLTLHFLVRDKKLNLFVNMRTNDIINLLPYDIFHHTFIQKYVAHQLGLKLGSYFHFATHMYYPKKREREGRNFLEKLIHKLEKANEAQWEHPVTELRSTNIEEDFQLAYKILYESSTISATGIDSKLIRNMVNYIQLHPVDREFNFLNTRD